MWDNINIGLAMAIGLAYLLDLILGDPVYLPHPIVYFGRIISFFEKRLNSGNKRLLKGGLMSVGLIGLVFIIFLAFQVLSVALHEYLYYMFVVVFFFFGIANRTLIREGIQVFKVLEEQGLGAGRKQLSRIVGRDTSQLSAQQIRKAALETMAENLSDGVIAPVFWFIIFGIPGMMAYKMINTLDSMIGYKSDRYLYFGRVAAYIDDIANFIPARLTAILMAFVTVSYRSFRFIFIYGNKHSSPNAGYPEAALAGILNAKFGGPSMYHGTLVSKPYIGDNEREFKLTDVYNAVRVNHLICAVMISISIIIRCVIF